MAWYDAALVGIFNDIIGTGVCYQLPVTAGEKAYEFLEMLRGSNTPIHISASIETYAAVYQQGDRTKDSEFHASCCAAFRDVELMADHEWEEETWIVERPTAVALMSMMLCIPWLIDIYDSVWEFRDSTLREAEEQAEYEAGLDAEKQDGGNDDD